MDHRTDYGGLFEETGELLEADEDATEETLMRMNGNYYLHRETRICSDCTEVVDSEGEVHHLCPPSQLEDLGYAYVDPVQRIQGFEHPYRSGGIILLPRFMAGNHERSYFGNEVCSQHGSLYPGDSCVTFVISGSPLLYPHDQAGGSIVDVAPTVAEILGFTIPDADGTARVRLQSAIR